MNDWLYLSRNRRDAVTVPTIWIAVAISLLVHVAVLWKWLPRIRLPSPEQSERGEARGSLVVQLVPPARPPSAPLPSAPPQVAPPPPPPPPRAAVRRPPAAPVIALKSPAGSAAPPPAPPVTAPTPPRPPATGDFASDIEARRRARSDTTTPAPPAPSPVPYAAPAESDNARANRIAAANLATQRKQTFGYDPTQGGGVFQITRIGYTDAEFLFFGWNRDIRRNTKQLIEVQKGNNADTRIAVVRKMISIIRDYEREDFLWESQRLGRSLMLSARARDNAGLEAFMMHEFFPEDPRVP